MNQELKSNPALLRRAMLLVLGVVLAGGALSPWARAGGHTGPSDPARSGTVLNPANYTGPATCWMAADCRVWLKSRCDPELAGHDPAAFASIVDVRQLAGSQRSIAIKGVAGTWMNGIRGAYYEFWSRDCVAVGSVLIDEERVAITIPANADWMTVPGQTGPYFWELR